MLGKFQKKKSFLSTKRNGDPDGQNPAVSTAKPSLLPMGRGGGNLTDGIAQTLMDERVSILRTKKARKQNKCMGWGAAGGHTYMRVIKNPNLTHLHGLARHW